MKRNIPVPPTEEKPSLNIEVPMEELEQVQGGRRRDCRSLCPWASGICTCWAGTTVCQSR